MDKQDWYDMGAQIGDLVQSAVDSKDFQQLNKTITDTINSTMELMQKNMQGQKTYRSGQTAYGQARSRDRGQTGAQAKKQGEGHAFGQAGSRDRDRAGRNAEEKKLPVKTAGGYKGITFMAVGYTFMAVFGILFVVFSMLSGAFGFFGAPAVMCLIPTVIFLIMGLKGTQLNNRVKRQKQYLGIMGGRDTCTLKELAAGTGKTEKFVAKDLREMIQGGMFQEGAYLDRQETCLMTSHSAYLQYQETEKQYEQRKAQETREKETRKGRESAAPGEKAQAVYSEEIQGILKDGKEFIAHIHQCNDDIEDAVMSEKLDRLEQVVTKIFRQVEAKPESAPDLHKMMSYYLPITRKLVDAYRDLDEQAVEGQNITKTKQEIEASLDTINTAFENLLDSFFQDTAWDISSDITVLHTMMAQDGLMKKDFAPGERVKTVASDFARKTPEE